MTKETFWPDAARGGVVVGAIAVAAAFMKVWTTAGFMASLAELVAVAYCIYVFGRRRGEQTYGEGIKFVLATMLLAGLIYGAGYYFLVNYWAVDFFTQQLATAEEAVGKVMQTTAYDKQMAYRMMANPIYWLFYGVLAEVFYGGLIGLFVVTFIRKR
jgi:hypothetical protein